MNLFENLQIMKESKNISKRNKLIERTKLKVSEYNKLKYALNVHNNLKSIFILNPGKVTSENNYQITILIKGAFKDYEHTHDNINYYGSSNIKADEATRLGSGIDIYKISINLIDESVKFQTIYGGDRYLNDYINRVIKTMDKFKDMDAETIKNNIINIIETSKKDVEKVLKSKNFIYNLTGKADISKKDDKDYNLNLENITLTEDFDPSMPNWLKRAIKDFNDRMTSGHKDYSGFDINLDTLKWTVEKFPTKGKLSTIANNEIIALLIDKSGDSANGDYIVYCPALYLGMDEDIYINSQYRKISNMSLKTLAPYVKEFAHAINSQDAKNATRQKQYDRADSRDNTINRIPDDERNDYKYSTSLDIDKSGYLVDPNKYTKLLAQKKSGDYLNRLENLYDLLTTLRTKIKDAINNDDFIPDAKGNRFASEFSNKPSYKLQNLINKYGKAVAYYKNCTGLLDKITQGNNNLRVPAFEEFNKYMNSCETIVAEIIDDIDSDNSPLTLF